MYKTVLAFMVIALTCHCSQIQTEQILPVFNPNTSQAETQQIPANMKVAFLGDSHDGDSFREVLKLIKSQRAELAVHMGDLSYSILPSGPRKWNAAITEVLGADFPYLATIGNHDTMHWHEGRSGYITLFKNRIKNNKNLNCQVDSEDADFGVKSFCEYKGLLVLLSGIGTRGSDHDFFIQNFLEAHNDTPWKVCAWHKNQRDMQVGSKDNEVGWSAYRKCNLHGAIVATGHEHSYSRTMTLIKPGDFFAKHGPIGIPEEVTLGYKKNFVFVNGLGGKSIRPYDHSFGRLPKWWASIYTSDRTVKNRRFLAEGFKINKEYGVLFVTFNYLGQQNKAKAQFITASGQILDEFMITRE